VADGEASGDDRDHEWLTVTAMTAPLLAVDAPSLLYRAFYALPDSIKGAGGRPVNALLGATNLILQEVATRDPRAVVLCLGPDAADYRVELYPDYHAARPEVPAGLVPQFATAPEFFDAFGWTVLNHDSLEADDLLGSLARLEVEAGGEALLLTGDRDMFQCASEQVTVLYLSTGVRGGQAVTPDEVVRRYGVPPDLVPDFIALRGDPSDGLPGAKGVGEKTAADLLRKHGSLEAVLEAAIGETRPKLRVALLDSRDELLAFKRIATLQDAGLKRPADRATDRAGGAAAAREQGMNALAKRLEAADE
jgi:5'-3' exonuclease